MNLGKKILGQILVMVFIITSCTPTDVPSARQNLSANRQPGSTSGVGGGSDNGAYPGGNDLGDGSSLPPKVEIRHLIEPNLSSDPNYSTGTGQASGGTYVRKLTLPKNFGGKLYVAGINISSLVSRHVSVRFGFGVNKETVTLPATIVQAPGITPQTPISVLVLDLKSQPFRKVRLPYDLYDYNDYAFDYDPSVPTDGMLQEPVQDNRDSGLFCRGLKLEDDPTFNGVGACDGKENAPGQAPEECLYAYAKVQDQGLLKKTGTNPAFALEPKLPQVLSSAGSDYYKDSFANQLQKSLGDTIPKDNSHNFQSILFSQDTSNPQTADMIFDNTWAGIMVGGSTYYYRGPYRMVDTVGWQFRYMELDGRRGLFKKDSYVNYTLGGLPDNPVFYDYIDNIWRPHLRLYYNSLMFPRATRLKIPANVPHLSSTEPIGLRTPDTSAPGESTDWMDGSNARVQSVNDEFNHVGSCNVTATMEIVAKDDNGVDFVIAQSKDVKLQLVRPTEYRTDVGNEVLYSNFKTCLSSTQCGSSECCINKRCWDNALVSQCLDNSPTVGNREVGQTCSTDLECTSLCCNRSTGRCSPHNTSLNPAVLCSKPVGEFCIAKEWCQKYPVTKRLIVREAPDPVTGALRCSAYDYQSLEYGDCRNSVCVPPVQQPLPNFDSTAPGACVNAVPAPNF